VIGVPQLGWPRVVRDKCDCDVVDPPGASLTRRVRRYSRRVAQELS